MRPTNLTAVMTHPAQYYAPWFRHIHQSCPDLNLHVIYATQPTPQQQGVGFGKPFDWDIPLTEGYSCEIVEPANAATDVHSDRFWGVDVPRVISALRASRPDVALIPGWHSVTLLRALRACRRCGVPVLYRGDTHCGGAPQGWKRAAWSWRTRRLLGQFSGYLSVGQRAREYLLHFGVQPIRIYSSPHCVDNEFFAQQARPHQTAAGRSAARTGFGLRDDDFVVLFVGKLEPIKRPLDVVQAVARLGPRVSLLVVGDGALLPECQREAQSLGVRAAWTGFLNQSEVGRAYAASDCLVLPSASETWGLVVNEALATGLPCIVSDRVGCAPDLVKPSETGATYPCGSVPELAQAIERLRSRLDTHDYSSACRGVAEHHSFAAATAGLQTACRAMSLARAPRPDASRSPGERRIIACCGNMAIVSGLERMTFEALRVIRERGAAVHCILNTWASFDRSDGKHPILELALPLGATWSTGYYWIRFDRRTRSPLKWARLAWDIGMTSAGLARDAVRFAPTHVLVPDFAAVLRNAPALACLRASGVPVILRLGNAPSSGRFYRRLFRWVINPLVTRFVCNSGYVRSELLAFGIPDGKISVIYNTLAASAVTGAGERNGSADPAKVLYVGQIIPEKGIDIVLDAVGILAGRGHDVRLDIVGGPLQGWVPPAYRGYRERLFERASQPDLAGRVQFLGQRNDVPALMAKAAVHACPSRPEMGEGMPNVVLEAKQAGLPTVAFALGPFPELIEHGRDGWICPRIGAEELADGLWQFLVAPERRDAAGNAAKASLSRFSREQFERAWIEVFQ